MGKKQHAIYSIGEDLASLRRNKMYTKECPEGTEHYLFDVNDYPMKPPSLVPKDYALTAAQSKHYAVLTANLRAKVIERTRGMLGLGLEEGRIN